MTRVTMDETQLVQMVEMVFSSGLNQLPTHTFPHTPCGSFGSQISFGKAGLVAEHRHDGHVRTANFTRAEVSSWS